VETISVFYLARLAEGFKAFERFAASYKKHPAGEPHELVVIAKGFTNAGQLAVLSQIFSEIQHKILQVPDSIGFDLHSYEAAALKIDSDYVCCLNTFTTFAADNWLKKLSDNLRKPGVGMVGATGSYESLINSFKVVHQIAWFVYQFPAMDRELTKKFAWIFRTHSPVTAAALKSTRLRIRRQIGDIVRARPKASRIAHNFVANWSGMLQPGGVFTKIRDFAPFPNPHIRTNVFMLRREDFLSTPLVGKDKLDCCRFESGPRGLSTTLRKRDLRLLVVGADGQGYEVEDWPLSGAFRSRDQVNILAHDNQSLEFAGYSDEEQRVIKEMTWGGYDQQDKAELEIIGVHFSKKHDVRRVSMPLPAGKQARLCSVVIPSYNRNKLVAEAVETVLKQNYANFELCIFDNASKVPLAETLGHLNDPRIRIKRSDTLLPVTSSWNSALDMAQGEYVTLIGDDDGLLPEFFDRVNSLADAFDNPDVIFSSLYQFMHPGVVPGRPEGYLATLPMADFIEDEPGPFVLSREQARRSVDNSLNLRRSFLFNMPAFTCRKSFLDSIRRDGKVLHSPFPDYYFANIAFELSAKTVCEPRPLAFQGVSKSSFGYTLLNDITDVGFELLGTSNASQLDELSSNFLPGPRYWTEYVITMEQVAAVLNDPTRRPNFARYRRHLTMEQMKSSERTYGSGLWKRLTLKEKAWTVKVKLIWKLSKRSSHFRSWWVSTNKELHPYNFTIGQQYLNSGDLLTGVDVYDAFVRGQFGPT
jgi:glycosyltransferase involved in cell wall biosynthesis